MAPPILYGSLDSWPADATMIRPKNIVFEEPRLPRVMVRCAIKVGARDMARIADEVNHWLRTGGAIVLPPEITLEFVDPIPQGCSKTEPPARKFDWVQPQAMAVPLSGYTVSVGGVDLTPFVSDVTIGPISTPDAGDCLDDAPVDEDGVEYHICDGEGCGDASHIINPLPAPPTPEVNLSVDVSALSASFSEVSEAMAGVADASAAAIQALGSGLLSAETLAALMAGQNTKRCGVCNGSMPATDPGNMCADCHTAAQSVYSGAITKRCAECSRPIYSGAICGDCDVPF